MGSKTNRNFRVLIDPDPQPVESIPPAGQGISPGRGKDPRYVQLQARLMLRPGVDHLIAVLPARTAREVKDARTNASGLRGSLKRYNIVVTERKLGDEVKLYGHYKNGTTA